MSISIPSADYTPQLTGYTGQGAFRFWCQKVLPIVYDDSLSYYELLNKVVNYLNNVIEDMNSVIENVDSLNESYSNLQGYVNTNMQLLVKTYNQLEAYVNDYFENLDVGAEIDRKLDEMAASGSLSNLIRPIVSDVAPDIVTDWLDNHITPTTPAIDSSLSVSGAGADAKVTGDYIRNLVKENGYFNNTFINFSDSNVQFYFKDYYIEGYYSNNGVWDESLGSLMRSVICPVKQGAKICYCGRLSQYGCVVAFLDSEFNFIDSIKVLGQANLAVARGFLDCSSETYSNIAYVVASNYASNDAYNYKTAYLFVTYDSTKLGENDDKNYVTMLPNALDEKGAFSAPSFAFFTSHDGTHDNLWNTGFIQIDNKKVNKVEYKCYLSNSYYAVLFFDTYYNPITNLCVKSSGSGPALLRGVIDISGSDYNNVRFVMGCTFVADGIDSNRHGEYIKVFSDSYADILRSGETRIAQAFTQYSRRNFQYFFKNYNVTGYYNNTGVWDESLGALCKSVICPVEQGAKIYYSGRLSPYGCVIAFLDNNMQFIDGIQVVGADGVGVQGGFIDCSGSEYSEIAYVVCSNFAYNDNYNYKTGYIFITYESIKLDNEDPIRYLPMIEYPLDKIGAFRVTSNAFYTTHNGTDNNLWNTGFIEIDNKTCSKVVYRNFINNTYYSVVFFDKFYRILPDLCVVATTTGAYVREGEIDISSGEYDEAKFVMVCTFVLDGLDTNRHGDYVKIVSEKYLTALKTEIQSLPPALNYGTARIFKKVVCVGDSYTAGWHKVSGDTTWTEQPEYAWPHYISDITSNQWLNCGVSGVNVWEWLESNNGLVKCTNYGLSQAYVVGLMINDTSELSLGSESDIGTENRTYYGGMSKVIRSLADISPTAHIFVCTCPKTTTGYAEFNQAVRDIVAAYTGTYKVHLLDLAERMSLFTVSSFVNDAINGHYTAIGYEQMAEIMNYVISDYIDNHVSNFQDVYKIPYTGS